MSQPKPWEKPPNTPGVHTKDRADQPLNAALLPKQCDAAPIGAGTTWLDKVAQKQAFEKLTIEEQCKREIFVREYLYDFSQHDAACRTGVPDNAASTWAGKIMREPWVRNRLKEVIEEIDEKVIVSRNRVLHGLLEEAQRCGIDSSQAARVAAWSKIAQILGMMVEKTEQVHTFKGGVMVVPATGTAESWGAQAASSQASLKDEVRK